jgi:integrase
MATVRKLASGKWNAQIRRKGHTPISKTFINQKDAFIWIRCMESEMDKGTYINRSSAENTTLEDVLIRYRNEITLHKKGYEREQGRINHWLAHPYSKHSLSSLKSVDFAKYRDARLKEVSTGTVRLELALISHVFTILRKEWNFPADNPVTHIRKPKPSRARNRRLENDEKERLLTACKQSRNPQIYPLVVMAIETGMRLGELLKMEWADINLSKRTIFLDDTKNGSSRTIPLSYKAIETLINIPNHIKSKRVFWIWPQKPDAISGAWRPALKRAEIIGLRFHDLRHEATSHFFERGLNILEVAAITGHKSIQMLQRYTHIRPESLVSKLDGRSC